MKVTALRAGFFGNSLHEAGQEFEVPAGTKGSWFVGMEEYKAPVKAKSKAEQATLSQAGKAENKTFLDVHGDKADLA